MSYSDPYTTLRPPVYDPPPRSRAVPRVLSGLLGLVVTPVALGLLAAGGYRQQQLFATMSTRHDALGIALLAGGPATGCGRARGVVVFGAAVRRAPWGVLPGVVALATAEGGFDLLDLLPHGALSFGLTSWLFSGALLAVGFLLVGTGLATTMARRRPRR